jgi:formate hydrogenlyase subunit 3/multisubunit Na+/H+ antiporter MnhD subunit
MLLLYLVLVLVFILFSNTGFVSYSLGPHLEVNLRMDEFSFSFGLVLCVISRSILLFGN